MKQRTLLIVVTAILFFSINTYSLAEPIPVAKPAVVAIATSLHKKPSVKSEVITKKQVGEQIKIGKRHRAWYFVNEQAYPNAWIKMLAVQLAIEPKRTGKLGVVSLIDSMTTKPTASTAVRGFDQHAFANATPNKALLSALDSFKPTRKGLAQFIGEGKLNAVEVPHE